MKYFIYTRKSTDSEERQILSIESQISELKEFAAKEKLEIVQSERVASAGGRKGGLGGIPPALQILCEICSNFFERTPQTGTFDCKVVYYILGIHKFI